MHALKYPALALLSSVLLLLSFPSFDFGFLAWLGLVPLLVALNNKSLRYSFFLSLVCGTFFFAYIFQWNLVVPKYTYLHHFIITPFFGFYFGVFGLTYTFISRRCGLTTALFAAPFLWVSLEYVRSNLSFLALPWALLAHSQYQYPIIIQIASVTGTYGISFLIVMVNSAITAVTYRVFRRSGKTKMLFPALPSKRGEIALVASAVVSSALVLLFGYMVVSKPIRGQTIKVSIVQGNIEQPKKWDPNHAEFIMQTYTDLTDNVSTDEPALIVWPETATPRSINRDPRIYAEVKRIAREANTFLLLGSSQQQKFEKAGSRELKYFNSAFLIQPPGRNTSKRRYDKIHLLPFGEYIPLKGIIPWSYINIPDLGRYAPGKDFTVFKLPNSRFGVTICWENIFPDLFRQFVKSGAQFMVNITNEAWFGKTAAPYQFVSMSVLRAVENRVYIVRCANTGVSCFIDPCGRIIDRVMDGHGQDIFIRGVLTGLVIPMENNTFYTRHGDWLALLSLPCSLIFLLVALGIKNRKHLPSYRIHL